MECLSKLPNHYRPRFISTRHHRPSPFSSVSFGVLISPFCTSTPPWKCSIKASSSSPAPLQNPSSHLFETLKPITSTFIKTTCIAIAAAALSFMQLNLKPSLAFAAPATLVPTKESSSQISEEEREKDLEVYLNSHPDDVQALRELMEIKTKFEKFGEAIVLLDRLIQVEPDYPEWPLLKAHIQNFNGDSESAKVMFEEILAKDPLRMEAFHGLVMAVSQSESGEQLGEMTKRIEMAMKRCMKENKMEEFRDFKLLIAQIKVIEGHYIDALKVYQELVKEDPRDFRPHLCQGIIYTLLSNNEEAEKHYEKYRRLVPKEHPLAQHLDTNMISARIQAQRMRNEKAVSGR